MKDSNSFLILDIFGLYFKNRDFLSGLTRYAGFVPTYLQSYDLAQMPLFFLALYQLGLRHAMEFTIIASFVFF